MKKKKIQDEKPNEISNRWHNVYWFSRMLINTDKYGAIGQDDVILSVLAKELQLVAKESKGKNILNQQKQKLRFMIEDRFKKATKRIIRVKKLLADLDEAIQTDDDMDVFIFTCENVLQPLHQAITNLPNDDKSYTLEYAKSHLDKHGEQGLAELINLWDDLGVQGCLEEERKTVIENFAFLRDLLTKDESLSDDDRDIVLTAFIQEFERRAAQKRKTRAGGSLEDVTSYILRYFHIKCAKAPEHFQADLEVDNWVKTKDGWYIGISCKRTIRERWKNVSSSTEVFSRFKVKYIFHIVTFDADLSDDKLTLLGEQRQIFYLPDSSEQLKHASEHVGLKDYVRPISQLIRDIKKELKSA